MMADLDRLRTAWTNAWLHKDVGAIDRMMTDDYVYIAPDGTLTDRDQLLALARAPGYRLLEGSRTDVAVSIIGVGAAAIVHRWRGRGSFQGRPFVDDHRSTMVCCMRHGQWQILLEHCSPIVEASRHRVTEVLPAQGG